MRLVVRGPYSHNFYLNFRSDVWQTDREDILGVILLNIQFRIGQSISEKIKWLFT